MREKLHRPKERKRFEYSSSLFFPNPPRHFPSLSPAIPMSRTHACTNGVVIILAIRNVAIRAKNEGRARYYALRAPPIVVRGPSGVLRGPPGSSPAPGDPGRVALPVIVAGSYQRSPRNRRSATTSAFLRIGGGFRTGCIPRGNISRGCGARVPSERIDQQPGVIRDYYFYRNDPLASPRFP